MVLLIWTAEGISITQSRFNNKTKRTLSQHIFNYGETKPVLVYRDSSVSPVFGSDYINLKSEYKNTVPSKQIKFYSLQHPSVKTIHEFPYSVSNAQINQPSVFNDGQIRHYKEQQLTTAADGQKFIPTETVVFPVEHKQHNVIMKQHPNYPSTNIKYYLIPLGKRIQGNQKMTYEGLNPFHISPNHFPYVNQLTYQSPTNTIPLFTNQYDTSFQKVKNVPIINYVNYNHNPKKLNLNNRKYIPSPNGRRNIIPQREPLPVHFSSSEMPHKKHKTEDEEFPVNQKIDDTNQERLIHEDKEGDRNSNLRKHSRDFEENNHFIYNDDKSEEDEQDNDKDSSKHITLKRYPSKEQRNEEVNLNHRYRSYSSEDKQEHLKTGPNKDKNIIYKSINFSKEIDDSIDDPVQSKQSENIPVIRRNKLFREKWYLLKNIDDIDKE